MHAYRPFTYIQNKINPIFFFQKKKLFPKILQKIQMLVIVHHQIAIHRLVYQKYPHQHRALEVGVVVNEIVKYYPLKIENMIQKSIVVFG